MIPALMITYNRLEYTKISLAALVQNDCGHIWVIDNGSEINTRTFLRDVAFRSRGRVSVTFNAENIGIAGAMNMFLSYTKNYEYCIKIDNDTVLPPNFCYHMLPHMKYADIIQAKHHIIPATNPEGWEGFIKNMKKENGLLYNHFIGGSGIMFRRNVVNYIPETESPIGGWREFQRQNPKLRKAFCEDVSIKLLDEHGYEDFPEYYAATGRLKK